MLYSSEGYRQEYINKRANEEKAIERLGNVRRLMPSVLFLGDTQVLISSYWILSVFDKTVCPHLNSRYYSMTVSYNFTKCAVHFIMNRFGLSYADQVQYLKKCL